MGSDLLLVIVIVTAVVFDFTNGFHDTANAMATSIATRALRPKVAVPRGGRRRGAVRRGAAARCHGGGRLMLATIVDASALCKIILAAFAGGVGITAVFGFGVMRLEALQRAREDGERAAVGLNGVVGAICGAVCLAALVVGFIAMTHK